MTKTTKTIMALLTAMTMTTGAMGVTAYAEEANTAVVTESVQTDGVFSQGAEYHFIKGSDALILDGEGSFTTEEFDEIARQFSPRAIVIGDNVEIPKSGTADSEWLFDIVHVSSPYVVYVHKNSKAYDSWDKELLNEWHLYVAKNKLNLGYLRYGTIFHLNILGDDIDIYDSFNYESVVLEKGNEMENFLLEKGIQSDIAREIVGCYMHGLNDRISIGKYYPESKLNAHEDGTERNKATADYISWKCLKTAETEQDLLESSVNNHETGKSEVAKFLAENNFTDSDSLNITMQYIVGSKEVLSLSPLMLVNTQEPDEKYTEEKTSNSVKKETVIVDENDKVKVFSEKSDDATLKGDADLSGEVDLADLTTVAKFNLNNELYPLANETAFANADMNGDGEVNGVDTSALIENQLGKK